MNIKLRRFAFPIIASLALLASCDRSAQNDHPTCGGDTVTNPSCGSGGSGDDSRAP